MREGDWPPRRRGAVVVLTRTDGQREIVARCCAGAVEAGVRCGMTVAHARALIDVEGAVIEAHDAAGDARGVARLAAWALRFTPVVAVDGVDGLWLDVTGCGRVHGGEARLARRVEGSLERLGFACCVAIAPTFAAAGAVARFGGGGRVRVGEGEVEEAVGGLPVRGLGVEEEVVDALAEVGIDRIDQVMAVAREELHARFGDAVVDALDRMMGRAFEALDPVRPAAPAEAVREFAGPVQQIEAIARTVEDLLAELCAGLERRGVGAREVRITVDRSDLEPVVVDVALSRATRDAAHLWTVVRPRMDGVHMGFGVDRVTVRAMAIAPLRHIQRAQWADGPGAHARDAKRIGEMVDVVVGRVGVDRVTMVRAVGSHIPERAFRHEPVVGKRGRGPRAVGIGALPPHLPRPTRMFLRAEPARVIAVTPDGPPYRIEWRGAVHEVVRAIGPERLAGEWWREVAAAVTGRTPSSHDYFRVCTREGRWVWMRREAGGSRWTVRGEWV